MSPGLQLVARQLCCTACCAAINSVPYFSLFISSTRNTRACVYMYIRALYIPYQHKGTGGDGRASRDTMSVGSAAVRWLPSCTARPDSRALQV